ncbi:redoxin domain-containing protein [Sinomicrobium weinanense]|uniref:Peroxiredoxin n=1 Tax=Sinomicrobium weinanense TaxID=2842200 RepID=A0A926JVN9_9FLAO|nr:peroxiredoxin [Sinomicrobium weinanense]MBU3125868.1 peroxiredoxin [Sinomicrobium weinanense]
MLEAFSKAPDFTLIDQNGKKVTLSEFEAKKNVVLAFYPFDWSPVCSDQISFYNEMHSLFEKRDAIVIGISVDSMFCHTAFAENRKLTLPLLADFEPKGEVAREYGVYNNKEGHASRALFVIDKNRTIVQSYLSPDSENPGADGILEALDTMNKA